MTYCFWGTTGRQPVKLVFTEQQAVCFIASDQKLDADLTDLFLDRKNLNLMTLAGSNIDGVYF